MKVEDLRLATVIEKESQMRWERSLPQSIKAGCLLFGLDLIQPFDPYSSFALAVSFFFPTNIFFINLKKTVRLIDL